MARRMYYAMDATFASSPTVEELGETHGAEGPLTIVVLLGMAKQQGAAGEVRTTVRQLARAAYLSDEDCAETILKHAIDLGTIEKIELGDRVVHVRFPAWTDWQQRQQAKDRQAEHRGKPNGATTRRPKRDGLAEMRAAA